jgi:hypothetical protein
MLFLLDVWRHCALTAARVVNAGFVWLGWQSLIRSPVKHVNLLWLSPESQYPGILAGSIHAQEA